MQGQLATFMNERFPTEVRATASGFCYHQGAIWGGLSAPIIAYIANTWHVGYAIPMMIGTMVFALSYILALLVGPETKGKELVAELSIA
jgi:SHS family lactate transporter-like MFS transporter